MPSTQSPVSTVFLVTDGNPGGSFGTAFVIYRDKSAAYCLTCAHVVQSIEPEKIQVGGYKSTVFVAGKEGQDPDLAILRVEELKNQPCWSLRTSHKEGTRFITEGFYKEGRDFYQRKLLGKLGNQISIHLQGGSKSVYGWDLRIDNEKKLRPGNSGSPVWEQKSRYVLGVVSRRQVEGHEGLAISIDALQEIWKDMPSGLIKPPPKKINPIVLAVSAVGVITFIIGVWQLLSPKNLCPLVSLQPTNEFQQPNSGFSGTIRIAGSTSMDNLTESLKRKFANKYNGAKVFYTSSGSEDGKQKLDNNLAELAAVSEYVSDEELQQKNWKAFTIAPAPIAVIIGQSNPYPKAQGLTSQQVEEIYTGRTTQWSQLQSGRADSIRIINRNRKSGTRTEFQSLALKGQPFGSAPVVEEWGKDETNAVIRELKENGIYYATCHQAAVQSTARILKIDGEEITSEKYLYRRAFRYVYKVDGTGKPSNNSVSNFLGFVDSQEGRKIIQEALSGKPAPN